MKTFKLIPIFLLLILAASCDTVSAYSDYDKTVDFTPYKTYAYFKPGIDKVEISDLDKKRILKAIDDQMAAKGFTKSEDPDVLINIFTKAKEQVNISQYYAGYGYGWGYGWGWGYSPYMYGGTSVSRYTEGTLFIDIIDAKKKEMIWQGQGIGTLYKNIDKKDARITEFVTKILAQYPPVVKK